MAEAIAETIPCDICQTQVILDEWTSHADKCVRPRPAPTAIIRGDDDEESNEHGIPCEFCEAVIGMNDWESHSRDCADTHWQGNQPALTLIPCEYCDELVSDGDWDQHLERCVENHRRHFRNLQRRLERENGEDVIPCESCDKAFPVESFEAHQTECRNKQSLALFSPMQNGTSSNFPSTWEPAVPNLSRFIVEPGSPEYAFVTENFHKSLKQNTVVEIDRIQNRRWYRQYDAHKEDFIERYGKSTEQWLFHGCKSDSIEAIINDCFNRSHATRCAAGQGIYFATQAATSLTYTHPNSDGVRHMFMARVLVGKTTTGNPAMRVCPPGFDTTGTNAVFVTYHDAQAYGEYLIAFR